jgi:hypothetical protein
MWRRHRIHMLLKQSGPVLEHASFEASSFGLFRDRILLALTRSLCVLSSQTHSILSEDIYNFFGSKLLL